MTWIVLLATPPTWDETHFEAPSLEAARTIADAYVAALLGADAGIACVRVELLYVCDACEGPRQPGQRACKACSGAGVTDSETSYRWAPGRLDALAPGAQHDRACAALAAGHAPTLVVTLPSGRTMRITSYPE
jgi:hypothetical protein